MPEILAPGSSRVLRGVPATIEWRSTDYNGEPIAAAGAVTVAVANALGTEVLASAATSAGEGVGAYTRALTSTHTANLQRLTATWTSATDGATRTTLVEVVGGFYFSAAQMREFDDMDNDGRFPLARLIRARRMVEDLIESFTNVAWVPRYEIETIDATNTNRIMLRWQHPTAIKSVSIDGVSKTVSEFTALPDGTVVWNDGTFVSGDAGNVVIGYEHGYSAPPEDLRDAAIKAARWLVLGDRSGISPRALGVESEFGNIRFATAGKDRPFGLPDIDAVVVSHRHVIPGIA